MDKKLNLTDKLEMRDIFDLNLRNKHLFSLISFLFVVLLTIALYLIPDYYFLERITSDVVFRILKIYQYDVRFDGYYIDTEEGTGFFAVIINFLTGLDAHNAQTPAIKSPSLDRRFAIVRACTGMQAGALLMALIMVTPARLRNKIKGTFWVLIALIVGNFLRIALDIGMSLTLMENYGLNGDTSWTWSHEVIGKPIGFFGTIFFALIIERQGVPILNTISLWIDSFLDLINRITTFINNKLRRK
ncbi:MAG: heimdallarchaeosortase [Candidatus Heimdallarchaeaceae archaeon]